MPLNYVIVIIRNFDVLMWNINFGTMKHTTVRQQTFTAQPDVMRSLRIIMVRMHVCACMHVFETNHGCRCAAYYNNYDEILGSPVALHLQYCAIVPLFA